MGFRGSAIGRIVAAHGPGWLRAGKQDYPLKVPGWERPVPRQRFPLGDSPPSPV
jgi:hypothetical protein